MGRTRPPTDYSAHGAIDSHAHLERAVFAGEVDDVLQRAFAHDLSEIILVAAAKEPAVFAETIALAARDVRLHAIAGIHPHYAVHQDVLKPALLPLLQGREVLAIGEFGLDFHYDLSPREVQRDVMKWQLDYALEHDFPIVLHLREAMDDALAILDAAAPTHDGVVHCFSGSRDEAEAFLARGFHLSVPGIVTFGRKVADLADAVSAIPLDRLLVETDSPYLAPHPFRGRRNEPAYVAFTVAEVARLHHLTPEEVAAATRENTRRVFRLEG